MAVGWKSAQEREVEFWKDIYIEQKDDIKSYTPITSDMAISFTMTCLGRFDVNLDDLNGLKFLDGGCGPYGLIKGIHTLKPLFTDFPMMTGIDPLIDFYKTLGSLAKDDNINYIASKVEDIEGVANESYDIVMSTNVIDHVDDPDKAISELVRVVKKGQKAYVSVHVVNFPYSIFKFFLKYIDKNHPHHFTKNVFINKCSKFGKVTELASIPMGVDQPDFSFRNIFKQKNFIRSIKRFFSSFVLSAIYVSIEKEK